MCVCACVCVYIYIYICVCVCVCVCVHIYTINDSYDEWYIYIYICVCVCVCGKRFFEDNDFWMFWILIEFTAVTIIVTSASSKVKQRNKVSDKILLTKYKIQMLN